MNSKKKYMAFCRKCEWLKLEHEFMCGDNVIVDDSDDVKVISAIVTAVDTEGGRGYMTKYGVRNKIEDNNSWFCNNKMSWILEGRGIYWYPSFENLLRLGNKCIGNESWVSSAMNEFRDAFYNKGDISELKLFILDYIIKVSHENKQIN